jgi:phenylacetaldehyde dehydrogenase
MNAQVPSPAAAARLDGPHRQLIDGVWREGGSATLIEVENPAWAVKIADVRAADMKDLDDAVASANRAFKQTWGRMSGRDRAAVLFKYADLLAANAARIAEVETLESGIPLPLTLATLGGFTVDLFRYYAGWATKIEGSTIPAQANGREAFELLVYTVREPVGVVGAIVPWNAPTSMIGLKMAPALAAGCTLVFKSAELTPLSAEMMAELWSQAGGPDGAFNLIHGNGHDVGAALVRHPGVHKISFTGSTAVGKEIVRAVADDLKKVSLELGGKSPFVVFPDADLDLAVPSAAMACFFLSGQNCMAGTRLFVHRDIEDEFLDRLALVAQGFKVGDGLDPTTVLGPLISARQKAKVGGFIDDAVREGGRIAWRGEAPDGPGYFQAPVIVADVLPGMRLAREEVFGPVLGVQRFADDAGLLQALNQTEFGLSGSVWTRDLARAHRMARAIDSGQVGVNIHAAVSPETPFGGNRQSGWGREFGREGLDGYLKTKAISVNLGPR